MELDMAAVERLTGTTASDGPAEVTRHGEVTRNEGHSVARWIVAVKRGPDGTPSVDLREWIEPKPGHEVVTLPKGSKRKGSAEGKRRFRGWTRKGLWMEPHEAELLAQALADAAFEAAAMRAEGEVA